MKTIIFYVRKGVRTAKQQGLATAPGSAVTIRTLSEMALRAGAAGNHGGHPRREQKGKAEVCDFAHPRAWCNGLAHDSVSHPLHLRSVDRPVRRQCH
jgi:hypothetical protein